MTTHPAFEVTSQEAAEANIRAYRARYYDGDPTIDDATFDALLAHYRTTFPDSPVWDEVGSTPTAGRKVEHVIPMTSLDNAIGEDAFRKWRSRREVGIAYDSTIIVEPKLDGLSVELVYQNSHLVEAVTRGDGIVGESVFHTMKDVVPRQLDPTQTGGPLGQLIVRGEAMILNSDFDAHLADTMRNARNAAAGIVRRRDPTHNHLINFFAFSVTGDAVSHFTTESERLAQLDEWGFEVPFHATVFSVDDVVEIHRAFGELRGCATRHALQATEYHECVRPDYEYDGLVIKFDSDVTSALLEQDSQRGPHDNPYSQVAFKWAELAEETTLNDVELEVGRTGAITPVAILDPVAIGGVTVRRASLCNWDEVKRLGVHLGSRVRVVRSGEVVPKVIGLVDAQTMANRPIREPEECPVCAAGVKRDGPRILCTNPVCPAKAERALLNWLQKRKILGWGPEVCAGLVDRGYTAVVDLYRADTLEADLEDITGSVKTATKLMGTLEASKPIALDMLIGCYGIDGVGRSEAANLIDLLGITTLDEFVEKVAEPSCKYLLALPGFKERKATKVQHGVYAAAGRLRELAAYLTVEGPVEVNTDGDLAGVSFCFTGVRLSEEEKTALAAAGAVEKSGVSSGLSYLVAKDPGKNTGKLKKARDMGVPIIGLDEFRALLNG